MNQHANQEPQRKGPTTSGRLALLFVLVLTLSTIGVIYALVMSMR